MNTLFGVQVAAMAEVLSLLEKSGIEVGKAIETLGAMPVKSPAAKGAGALIAAGHGSDNIHGIAKLYGLRGGGECAPPHYAVGCATSVPCLEPGRVMPWRGVRAAEGLDHDSSDNRTGWEGLLIPWLTW